MLIQYRILAIAAVLAGAFGSGWVANGWRLGEKAAEIKADAAIARAESVTTALNELAAAGELVKESAAGAYADIDVVNARLAKVRKDPKNANPPPLPVDCVPGDIRVQRLNQASAAVDEAIARSVPSGTVQAKRVPEEPL